jgi:hypothetical protein
MYLLTRDTAKTAKATGTNFINVVMFLEPGGWRCPNTTAECLRHCLRTSGRLKLSGAEKARRSRTEFYRTNPVAFMGKLYGEIRKFVKYCHKNGKFPAVRLNGLSDLDWRNVYHDFPEVQFYEYTKRPGFIHDAITRDNPLNVHYTLSWTGSTRDGGNAALCVDYLAAGGIVAQIATVGQDLYGEHYQSTDGDRHDLRFLDPPGTISRLKPKGAMKAALKRGEHFAMVLE